MPSGFVFFKSNKFTFMIIKEIRFVCQKNLIGDTGGKYTVKSLGIPGFTRAYHQIE